jgi:hypothetical protein
VQPGTIAYATGWGATIPDDKLGPLGFLVPKEQKRPKVLQVMTNNQSFKYFLSYGFDTQIILCLTYTVLFALRLATILKSMLNRLLSFSYQQSSNLKASFGSAVMVTAHCNVTICAYCLCKHDT